jgi:uncharacterized protein involved in exopolysaccharide biosynthesis
VTIYQLTTYLRTKVHPDVCLTIGRMNDKTTWRADGGTAEQRAAAQAILDSFDPVQAQAEIEAEEAAEKARAEWLKTAKAEVDSLKVQKADKAAMEAMQKAITDKDALISKLSTDVATLTTQLQAANTKLSELNQLKADVAALKVAKVEPTK